MVVHHGWAGTHEYLDPCYEQLGQLCALSDVYGLGLIMCQLLMVSEGGGCRGGALDQGGRAKSGCMAFMPGFVPTAVGEGVLAGVWRGGGACRGGGGGEQAWGRDGVHAGLHHH